MGIVKSAMCFQLVAVTQLEKLLVSVLLVKAVNYDKTLCPVDTCYMCTLPISNSFLTYPILSYPILPILYLSNLNQAYAYEVDHNNAENASSSGAKSTIGNYADVLTSNYDNSLHCFYILN